MLHFRNISVGDPRRISSAALSGDKLIVGTQTGSLLWYHMELKKEDRRHPVLKKIVYPPAHENLLRKPITAMKFSHCCQYLAVGFSSGAVVVYIIDQSGGMKLHLRHNEHKSSVLALSWSTDSVKLFSGCFSGRVVELNCSIPSENKFDDAFYLAASFFGAPSSKMFSSPFSRIANIGSPILCIDTLTVSEFPLNSTDSRAASLCDYLLVSSENNGVGQMFRYRQQFSQSRDMPNGKFLSNEVTVSKVVPIDNTLMMHAICAFPSVLGDDDDESPQSIWATRTSSACFVFDPSVACVTRSLSHVNVNSLEPGSLQVSRYEESLKELLAGSGSNSKRVDQLSVYVQSQLPSFQDDNSWIIVGTSVDDAHEEIKQENGNTRAMSVAMYCPSNNFTMKEEFREVTARSSVGQSPNDLNSYICFKPVYTSFGTLLTVIVLTAKRRLFVLSTSQRSFQPLPGFDNSEVLSLDVSGSFILVLHKRKGSLHFQLDMLQILNLESVSLPLRVFRGNFLCKSITLLKKLWKERKEAEQSAVASNLAHHSRALISQSPAREGGDEVGDENIVADECKETELHGLETAPIGSMEEQAHTKYNESDSIKVESSHKGWQEPSFISSSPARCSSSVVAVSDADGVSVESGDSWAGSKTSSTIIPREEEAIQYYNDENRDLFQRSLVSPLDDDSLTDPHNSSSTPESSGTFEWLRSSRGVWLDRWQGALGGDCNADDLDLMDISAVQDRMLNKRAARSEICDDEGVEIETEQDESDSSLVLDSGENASLCEILLREIEISRKNKKKSQDLRDGKNVYTVELSLSFSSLGLNLGVDKFNRLRVVSFQAMPYLSAGNQEPNVAEQCGLIGVGDVLIGVNNVDLSNRSADECFHIVKRFVSNSKLERFAKRRYDATATDHAVSLNSIRLTFVYEDAANPITSSYGDVNSTPSAAVKMDRQIFPFFDIFEGDSALDNGMTAITSTALEYISKELKDRKNNRNVFHVIDRSDMVALMTPSLFLLDSEEAECIANYASESYNSDYTIDMIEKEIYKR